VLPFVRELVSSIGRRSALAHLYLKIQCRLAYIKGDIRLKEKVLLRDVAENLGFNKAEFLEICTEMQRHTNSKQENGKSFLRNAYNILQLEPDVEDGEIRRAYLRMMSRYHPDKLVRENLSEETLKLAQEKSTAIRSAYETVCGFRKIRV
jgi:DnaJ like chaperone protein